MILSKKLTMTLLCSCLLHSYCGGMEQPQEYDENNKDIKKTTHVMDDFYDEAILHLRFHIQDPNNPVHVSAATIQLQLASERGHLLAEKLLPFVKACFQRILNKSEDTRETITALCAIRFSAGYFEDGFNTLLTLLRYKCNDMCNLIDLILSEKFRSAFLFNKFKILGDSSNEKSIYSKSDINHITQTFLDNFTFTDIYKDYYLEIQPHTQAAIGKIFIEASLNTPESNSSVISGSRLKGVGVCMPNSTNYYFLEGVKFCIYAAKQNDHDAYETLAKALRITEKYDYFFVQIYNLFKTGDEQAQDLFNRIAFQDNQVLLGFDKYINKLEVCSHNPGESTAVFDKVMINYKRYVNSQNPDVTRHSAVPLSSVAKDLTDKTTIQGVQGGGTPKVREEAKLSPEEVKQQKEYDDAMKLRKKNPSAWLWALLDVTDTSINRKVIAELNEIRESEGYKNPSKAKENDYGRILKEHEKTKGKEWFDKFDRLFTKKAKNYNYSDDEISMAALALDKAYRYGNLAAIEYVKKLKKLNSYKNSKTTPFTKSRDRLASTFAAFSAMFSNHIFVPNKENPSTKPMLQSSPQKGETQKTNNNNQNSNVGASGYSQINSSTVSELRVISSSHENHPREIKSTSANNQIEIQSNALPQIQPQPKSAPAPVIEVSPIVEEAHSINTHSDTLLGSKKRDHKESNKKKDKALTPALRALDDQLPTESKAESTAPSENKVKDSSERRVHTKKALMEVQPSHSSRRLERHSSSSKSIEDTSGIKENLSSEHSTSSEAVSVEPRERKSLHRTQSLLSFPSSSKTPHHNKELSSKETLNNETKPRKPIHRTLSLNNISLGTDSEESSVKKEKEKKKNKSPITKTSLKEHLSPKNKLERRDSEKKLALSVSEETSDYSSSEISTSDKPLVDLFKQDGKRDENLKHLKRLFNNRDLIKASDIKLNRSIVVRALRELGPNGKKIITWNFETPGNKNSSIIRADIIRTPQHSKNHELPTLNIHLHSRQGKWYEDANIKEHFLKFICACDPSVKTLVASFQKNNTNG